MLVEFRKEALGEVFVALPIPNPALPRGQGEIHSEYKLNFKWNPRIVDRLTPLYERAATTVSTNSWSSPGAMAILRSPKTPYTLSGYFSAVFRCTYPLFHESHLFG